MDIREQLIAYLEGTLTPGQRIRIARRLERSTYWQRELALVQQTHVQLRREMPLLGRPAPGQLEALLPTILDRADGGGRQGNWWSGVQTSLLAGALLATLLLIPLLLHSTSAEAVSGLQNVPQSTFTQAAQSSESAANVADAGPALLVTEEPDLERLVSVENGDGLNAAPSSVVRWAASPVPMPEATLEPSREAPGKNR